MPQHIPWVEVAVDEGLVVVQDRTLEDLDRPCPQRRLGHPFRQRIRVLRVHAERSDYPRRGGIDVVDVGENIDELAHPPLSRRPLRTSGEFGHQHSWCAGQSSGRVDTDQSRSRCRDPLHELQHGGLVRSDRWIVGDLLGTDRATQHQPRIPPRPTANASAGGAARCNARVTSPSWRPSARDSIASTVFGRHLAATNSTYRPSTSARSGGPTTTSNDDIPTIPDQPRELLPEKHTKPHRLPEYLQIGAQNQPAALAASSPPGAVSMRLSWRPSTARPVGAPSGDNSISAHRGSSSATSK